MIGRLSRLLRQKWWWWRIGHAIAQAEEETARWEAARTHWEAHPTGLPPPSPAWMQEHLISTSRRRVVYAAMRQRMIEERSAAR